MHVIGVMVIVMDFFYRIEAVMHVIDVMVMVMEVMNIVIRWKLYCM